MRYLTIFDLV
jgi:hypothetical protein